MKMIEMMNTYAIMSGERNETFPGSGFHGTRFMDTSELKGSEYINEDIRKIKNDELPIMACVF